MLVFLISILFHALIWSTDAAPYPIHKRADPSNVPGVPFPSNGNDQSCPTMNTNLFNQGIQKRTMIKPSDEEIARLRTRSLMPRQSFKSCTKIAHFDWADFKRPLGNTQDLFLFGSSTYTFSISSSVAIQLAYAWTAPFNSDHYTLIGTGGDGGQTATVTIKLTEDSHVHFEAFSDFEMSTGSAAVFKQDY